MARILNAIATVKSTSMTKKQTRHTQIHVFTYRVVCGENGEEAPHGEDGEQLGALRFNRVSTQNECIRTGACAFLV